MAHCHFFSVVPPLGIRFARIRRSPFHPHFARASFSVPARSQETHGFLRSSLRSSLFSYTGGNAFLPTPPLDSILGKAQIEKALPYSAFSICAPTGNRIQVNCLKGNCSTIELWGQAPRFAGLNLKFKKEPLIT